MFRRLRYHLELRGRGRSAAVPAPSERTWVHPSELPGSFERATVPPTRRRAGSRRFKVVVASSASAMLLAGGALLALPSATQPAGASTGPRVATSLAALPAQDRAAGASMLSLVLVEGQHLGSATAMVLPPGDLAVTTTLVPRGATVLGSVLGRRPVALRVVGSDPTLGVTVLHIPTTVPVTPTAPLAPAISTDGSPTTLTALASVLSTGSAQLEYAAAYLSAAPSAASVGRSALAVTHGESLEGEIAGSIVLDGAGKAVAAEVPELGATSFVSASFLQLLAQRIVLGSASSHGWLQVTTTAATHTPRVVSVRPGGASVGTLRPGDVILAVDSEPVRTTADVDSILYTTAPGEPVDLTLLRGGQTLVVNVVLAASP